jgi:hypothetical protein
MSCLLDPDFLQFCMFSLENAFTAAVDALSVSPLHTTFDSTRFTFVCKKKLIITINFTYADAYNRCSMLCISSLSIMHCFVNDDMAHQISHEKPQRKNGTLRFVFTHFFIKGTILYFANSWVSRFRSLWQEV